MNKKIQHKQMYFFLALSTIAVSVGFQGWTTLLNNFSVQSANISGYQMGIIQSLREVPGFLTLLVIYALLIISEKRIVALGLLIMGLGICSVGYFPSFYGIIFTTLIMSIGFHYGQAMSNSLSLQAFDKQEAPIVLGRLNSISAVCSIGIGIVIYLMAQFLKFKPMFLILGAVPVIVGIIQLIVSPNTDHLAKQKKKMVFRKKYWLFYVLTFLDGARRQISVAFAIFLLVDKFHYTLTMVTILFVVNNVVNYVAGKKIGKLVNIFGEQKVLGMDYISLTIVCLVYAFSHSGILVGAMYIMDNIFYNASVGISTFFQKIASKEDIASSTSVGFTINHIAAVVIPFIGGVLWLLHYRYVFFGAAFIAVISLIASQLIGKELKKHRVD